MLLMNCWDLEPLEVQLCSWITGNSSTADKKQLMKQNVCPILEMKYIFHQETPQYVLAEAFE